MGLALTAAVIFIGSTVGYSHLKSTPDAPQLVKESINSPRIKYFTLVLEKKIIPYRYCHKPSHLGKTNSIIYCQRII